jgi:hypothetical protein
MNVRIYQPGNNERLVEMDRLGPRGKLGSKFVPPGYGPNFSSAYQYHPILNRGRNSRKDPAGRYSHGRSRCVNGFHIPGISQEFVMGRLAVGKCKALSF